ncbi:unnamed protein product, partial [Heligmosomoides polygyrus]|uniref:Integrase catalytic domain-containing protein n=1 Tax=Heligmosomoides polygyrus TaxID=6339 RepID=A0A183F7Z5_HELPZ
MTRTALLDTGSQVSIIPLQMFVAAQQNGYDLDADVEEIELDGSKRVYDASGNAMSFKGAVRLTMQVRKGLKQRIGLFVMAGGDDMLVLGTNALEKLGWSLASNTVPLQAKTEAASGNAHRRIQRKEVAMQQRRTKAFKKVTVAERLYLKPGETKLISVHCDEMKQDGVLWSSDEILPDTVCQGAQHQVQIPVTNSFAGAKIFREGDVVGTYEAAEIVEREPLSHGDMLERTTGVDEDRDEKLISVPTEKQSSRNPKLANPWEGPYRVIESSDNSALITLIQGNREAVRVPFDLTFLSIDHPLNLRRKCGCGLFDQMAHVALPSLSHPMARSKRVADMFQLANVASISEQECWGDERKEQELRMKNSSYLTPHGLALAMKAHARRCHDFAEAVEQAQGSRFEHPAIFPWQVRYDIGAYVTSALKMVRYTSVPGASATSPLKVFLALPPAFGRIHAEVSYDECLAVYVYESWELLAQKLLDHAAVDAIVVVWPDAMPSDRSMRQTLIAVERHLQTGGTLLFFPFPYEDVNARVWTTMGEVCAEFVRYLTAPERKFEAVVADFLMDHGYLVLVQNDSVRRVVPPSKRRGVFDEAHAGLLAGHFGPKKLLRQLSRRVFWETMSRDVTKWAQECRSCLCYNRRQAMTPPLKPIVTTKPYELVGVDILEMGPTSDGNRYILSVVDHFTKFGGAYAIPSKDAATVARVLFERWIAEGGRQPKQFLSDQGG